MAEYDNGKGDARTVIEVALKRFKLCVEAERSIRELALEDLRFRAGQQWPEHIKSERDRDMRPCLTINRILPAIRQVTNDQRQNRGAIKVSPVDDKGDIETANVLQGLIRNIEYTSNADVAFDTAFDAAVTGSFGYVRVITDYTEPNSFDQVLKIMRVRNPFMIYVDPDTREVDYADAKFAFVVELLTAEEYKSAYPKSELAGIDDWSSIGDQSPDWVTKDHVRVVEYYSLVKEQDTLLLLRDTRTGQERAILKSIFGDEELPKGLEVLAERSTETVKTKWCKLNAIEILEETDWDDDEIPIVPVLGDELDIDGKRVLEGMVRHAKDPQRMLNYWKSAETEAIALAPRAPWVGAEGQFEGHPEWDTANTRSHSKLEYKPTSLNGQPVPRPERLAVEPAVMAITNASFGAADDIKAVTQVYDAGLGQRSNETSGRGIIARQQQGQLGNFHYIDNLTRARRRVARILVRMIPKIYNTPRILRIIGEDDTVETVAVNQRTKRNGVERVFDLTTGRYDVIVQTGPGFATRRKEAVESMMGVITANPDLMGTIGDLVIKNMDWPGAQEISERMKKMLPPQLQEGEDGQPPVPPQAQQKLEQYGQMIEALTKQLNEANDALKTKSLELASRERIEEGKAQLELRLAQLKLDSQEAIALLQAEVDAMKAHMGFDMQTAAEEAREAAQRV